MKAKESPSTPSSSAAASPTYRVNADAPPFFVLQGVNDTLVPVETARVFVDRLRAVSSRPVAYAELPLAQHAFDVLASLRCQATTSAVGDFLEGARALAGRDTDTSTGARRPRGHLSDARAGHRGLSRPSGSGLVGEPGLDRERVAHRDHQLVHPARVDDIASGRLHRGERGRRTRHGQQRHPRPHGPFVGRLLPAYRAEHLGGHGQHVRSASAWAPISATSGQGAV